ncbi:MAG TPA: hypothetical protein DCS07_11415 [Bdellovibrionales bacterium]|nr:MAG: hypothetical protein A2Z97_12885 [Bdellovibrionales bacterium GWB1_52_6]OFZ02822.1 MAG: hypothetical protein A2X97_04415 [Bdellovibrionales bacterium GWA1_52_35]OFZ33503.1 MAG: hypothetical protein A2070_14855 [Bdellovibrionales bacterium GWC1_52_8]HAR43217.1 hypothetical protein [Bdellovibrionales bacterium]HCM38404.1 hypothetical protein [Bdellovibrionales bacterium]
MRKALILMLLLTLAAPSVQAEQYYPFKHGYYGFRDLLRGDNLTLMAVGTGLTLVSLGFDDQIYNYFDRKSYSIGTVPRESAALFKREMLPSLIALGTLTYGLLSDREREIGSGQAQFEAIGYYVVLVASMKFLTFRNGPGGDSLRHAFPSGQVGFVTAGHLTRMYGWAYGLPVLAITSAGFVDYTFRGVHWMSDMIFGSVLGFAMGAAFADHHISGEADAVEMTSIMAYPILSTSADSGRSYGLGVQVRY